MIIDKQPLPEDPTPADSPPSYETLNAVNAGYPSSKGSELSSSPSSPTIKSRSLTSSPGGLFFNNKGKGRTPNWFNFFFASRTAREVRNTVSGLIRDLIREQHSSFPGTRDILESCAEACINHSLSLSSILQEKSIENHTPLYWAIVKRPPDELHGVKDASGPDILSSLLSYSTPLSSETIADVKQACLVTCDQRLFQRLRLSPEFSPVSIAEQMLSGGAISSDNIEVEDIEGEAFIMTFEVPLFRKRIVVSKVIPLEFIARNRMWRLEFFITPENGVHPGSWGVALSLLETSPPAWLNSRLVIPEAMPPSTKPKPIELKLRSNAQLEAPRRNNIQVMLQDSLMGSKLQYGKNPYIGLDETLRGRWEARLGTQFECIIC